MQKLIVIMSIAIALALLIFAGSRNDSAIPVNAQDVQQVRKGPTAVTAPQVADRLSGNATSNDQVFVEGAIAINWYDPPYRNFLVPNGTPLENYQYYKLLAESGNGLAAYQLVNMMSGCEHAYLTRKDLDEAIVQLRQTSTFYDPKYESTIRIAKPESVEKYISSFVASFENCKDFTAAQRDESDMWMELAANNGHTTAMLDYGRQLSDPLASVELYRSAWKLGDPGALRSLAEGLEQVYDEGIDPTAKVPAYVAMHAFVTLLRKAHGADAERVVGRWTLRNQAKLDEMARTLMPHELEAAVEQSRKLITENVNCCYSM